VSFLIVGWGKTKQSRTRQGKTDSGEELEPEARGKAILESGNRRLVHARETLQLHLAQEMSLASGSNAPAYALQRIGDSRVDDIGVDRFAHVVIAHDARYRAVTSR
jgi:hypothetical protein